MAAVVLGSEVRVLIWEIEQSRAVRSHDQKDGGRTERRRELAGTEKCAHHLGAWARGAHGKIG